MKCFLHSCLRSFCRVCDKNSTFSIIFVGSRACVAIISVSIACFEFLISEILKFKDRNKGQIK